MQRWLWTIVLCTGIAGCGRGAKMLPVGEAPVIRQGESMIVFMRPSGLGQAISASVFDVTGPAPKFVGIVNYGTKVAYNVAPGQYTFMVVSEAADFMQATVAPGRTYYALVTPRMGLWKARFSFRPVRAHEIGGPEFVGWSGGPFVENSPATLNWAAQNAADVDSKRTQYWPEWQSKDAVQRASQTLNVEDGKPTQSVAGAPATASAPLTGAARVEAVFWESIRASSNPADFRTYLEQYPNGMFAAAARERLAALEPPPQAAAIKPKTTPSSPLPRPGDAWTYRLTEYHRNPNRQSKYEVQVTSASAAEIVERFSMRGGKSGESKHTPGAYLADLGAPLFSPYLGAFQDLSKQPAFATVELKDPMCIGRTICNATARVAGRETIKVPAGSFDTIKVSIDQDFRDYRETMSASGRGSTTRQLHVWYSPEVKRAVKFSSRASGVRRGDVRDFDLELESYKLD